MNVCSHSTQDGGKGVLPLDRVLYFSGGSGEKGVRLDAGMTKKFFQITSTFFHSSLYHLNFPTTHTYLMQDPRLGLQLQV